MNLHVVNSIGTENTRTVVQHNNMSIYTQLEYNSKTKGNGYSTI